MSQPSNYPLPRTDEDPRFNFGLMLDLEKVLVEHGYPSMESGDDHIRLRLAMFRLLYAEADATTPP